MKSLSSATASLRLELGRFRLAFVVLGLLWVMVSNIHAQSTLVPVPGARAFAFDHSGAYLYITTTDGLVKRYNLTTAELITAYDLGGSLTGIDVAPDDSFILVGQGVVVDAKAIFYRINLNTGETIEMTWPASANYDGALDVAIAANGVALATTTENYLTADLLQINLATNTITRRDDAALTPQAMSPFYIRHSADRKTLFLSGDHMPATLYHADTNNLQLIGNTFRFNNAINRNGSLLVSDGAIDRASDVKFLRGVPNDGGFAFDGKRDILYALANSSRQIVAYDTNTFNERFRFNFPEQSGYNLVASDNGDLVALSNGAGVRLFKAPAVLPSPTPSPVPTTANRRDMVFNHAGTYLYISTSDGLVERANVAANAIDKVYNLGGGLGAVDIAPDDSFLLVAQNYIGIADGQIQRIDLQTDAITNLNFRWADFAGGPNDLAIASNGKALFTTGGRIGQLDLTTNQATVRLDIPLEPSRNDANVYGARLERSVDGSRLYFLEGGVYSSSAFTYSAAQDAFGPRLESTMVASAFAAAVNRNGSLLATRTAFQSEGITFDTPDLHFLRPLAHGDGGIAFDAKTDMIYAVDRGSSQVIAYDTNTLVEKFRLNIGVNIADQLGSGILVASPDGNHLAITTPTGLRILNVTSAIPSATPGPPVFDSVRDMIFDHAGTHLYITSDNGLVWPYNLTTNAMDPPYVVGGSLAGADISANDSYLLLAQGRFGVAEARLEKLDLNTREVTHIGYPLTRYEAGAYDVAIASNGLAFLTADGQGLFPVRQLNLANNAISIRSDAPGSGQPGTELETMVLQKSQIHRGTDRSRLYFLESGNSVPSFPPRFIYDSSSDQFGLHGYNFNLTFFGGAAVNRNGTLLASQASNKVWLETAPAFGADHVFAGPDGGVAFSGIADVVYAANSPTSQVIAYDTNTFAEGGRINIGETIPPYVLHFGPGYMVASQDGKFLALQTSQRIRLLNTLTGASIPISPASATPTPNPTPTPRPTATPKPRPSVVSVSVSPKQMVEGSDAVFTFKISPALTAASSVGITEKSTGGAGRGGSFGATSSVFFGVGQTVATVTLHTVADNVKQRKQKFTVKLLKSPIPAVYKAGNPSSATVTIVDVP